MPHDHSLRYHIFVSCFDVSADHHAVRLIDYLQLLWDDPRIVWSILGGEECAMLAQKHDHMQLVDDLSTTSSIGFLESLTETFRARGLFARLRKFLLTGQDNKQPHLKNWGRVDLFFAIDGQGRNLPLGEMAHRLGLRTAYFFPPLVMVWGKWNIRKMQFFNHVFCVFKPNWALYHEKNTHVSYVGHPFRYYQLAQKNTRDTGDTKQVQHTRDTEQVHQKALQQTLEKYQLHTRTRNLKEQLNLAPHEWLISLFPGSRHHEIRALMPIFLKTLQELATHTPHKFPPQVSASDATHPNKPNPPAIDTRIDTPIDTTIDTTIDKPIRLRFALALAHEDFRADLERMRDQAGFSEETLPILHGMYEELLSLSHIALTCSGTVTLKAAFLQTPHILTYKISKSSYWILRPLVKTQHIGMLNILANRTIIPEFINSQLSPAALLKVIHRYLNHPETLATKQTELAQAVETFCASPSPQAPEGAGTRKIQVMNKSKVETQTEEDKTIDKAEIDKAKIDKAEEDKTIELEPSIAPKHSNNLDPSINPEPSLKLDSSVTEENHPFWHIAKELLPVIKTTLTAKNAVNEKIPASSP